MTTDSRPNIILITSDQQRWDTAGRAAPPWMKTPNFNHLCRQGVEFTRAYADCPLCVPSRVTLMTGLAADRHGMLGNGRTRTVMDEDGTLPTLLKQAGYHTAAIGKMHFYPQRKRHGFDEMWLPQDYYNQMLASGMEIPAVQIGLDQNALYPALSTVPQDRTLTRWIAEQSAAYIRERRDPTRPFFLWTSFSKPHPPLDPPEPYYSLYRDASIPDPVIGKWASDDTSPAAFRRQRLSQSYDRMSPQILREARACYYGLITEIDYNLGRIFAALRTAGIEDETLILYTSDHGEYFGDHGQGAKGFFHEASAHVPLAMQLPRSWENRRTDAVEELPVTLADVTATILDAGGAEADQELDGLSLLPCGQKDAHTPSRKVIFSCASQARASLAATDGRWKYIWYPEGDKEQGFDLQDDPCEITSLGVSPDPIAKLKQAVIDHYGARGSDYVRDGALVGHPETREPEADLRHKHWNAFADEWFDKDIRH